MLSLKICLVILETKEVFQTIPLPLAASPPKCQRVTGNGHDASRLVQSSTSEGNSKPISSLSNLLTTESELFKAGEVGCSKNILASTLLHDLFAGGHLLGGTALTSTLLNYIPRENQHFYKAVMILIEMVSMDKQKVLLHIKKKEIPCVDVTVGKHFAQH